MSLGWPWTGQVGDPAAGLLDDDRRRGEILVAHLGAATMTASMTPVSRPLDRTNVRGKCESRVVAAGVGVSAALGAGPQRRSGPGRRFGGEVACGGGVGPQQPARGEVQLPGGVPHRRSAYHRVSGRACVERAGTVAAVPP
jgi:hypothetical protein